MIITVCRRELEQALKASPNDQSAARGAVTEALAANAGGEDVDIDLTNTSYLDLSGSSWESFLQDIVRRSKTPTHISVIMSFTCSRMRPDGFGGMAILIAPKAIVGKTTGDFFEDVIAEAGLDDEGPRTKIVDAADATAKSEGESGAGRASPADERERVAGLAHLPLSGVHNMSTRSKEFDFRKPVAYDAPAKEAFHRNARRQLKLLAAALGLPAEKFDLRSNKAGIAVSGEITMHADHLYVQVSQPALGFDSGILYRTCDGRKDYAGGPNNFASLNLLHRPEDLARRIKEACHV
jgi:hypothetical protein